MHIIIMIYDIIYRLVDDVKDAAESLIPPSYVEIENGKAEIKEIFILSNKSTVLGSLVFEGKMVLNSRCKILRKGDELFDSKIVSLRNLKNEVKEVSVGMECGIIIAPNFTVEKGDTVISYRIEKN